MHTMIVEEESEPGPPAALVDFLHVHHAMRDKETHNRLQNDLIQHTWNHVENRLALYLNSNVCHFACCAN
jgi:hypothetical protein